MHFVSANNWTVYSLILFANSQKLVHQMSDFMAKMHQIRFPLGLRLGPHWRSLQRSPRTLAVFEGSTFK